MANFDRHQQAVPEDIWKPFIEELYPNLMSQTHFFPPVFFHRTPQAVENIAGQTALVRDNPPRGKGPHKQPPVPPTPPPSQVAGRVFVDISTDTPPIHLQERHQRDDDAQQRCLDALSTFNEVMVVISCLLFRKYLSDHTHINPLLPAAQLPTFPVPSISIQDGEWDIVLIHRRYGLLIGEIKSIGNNDFFHNQTRDGQIDLIRKKMEEALKQLKNQETVLRHLVSDLPLDRITKTVLLPNISSRQLREALTTFPPLLQTLCDTLSLNSRPFPDVDQAVGLCLCEEDLQQPGTWWQMLHAAGPDQVMNDFLYQRLVARFCGPATSVYIPTLSPPRKVVRSLGQAVAETGLQFSLLTLTPTQVELLSRQPEPRFLYVLGPPGTGKTILLLLKAVQWVRQGRRVMIVCGDVQSKAVTLLVNNQLRSMVEPSYATYVQRHFCDFSSDDFDAEVAVTTLQLDILPYTGPVLVLMDEFDRTYRDRCIKWLEEVRAQLPAICVWAAGIFRLDNDRQDPPPNWMEVEMLQEPLRCPPTVSEQLQQSPDILVNNVPKYLDPQHPVATRGLAVSRGRHRDQPGHRGDHPWQCTTCADCVAAKIKSLNVGQPEHGLQYRDVWILYGGDDEPHDDDIMVKHLRQHHRLPLRTVRLDRLVKTDVRELALAISDEVIVTHCKVAQGLERRVIISLGAQGWSRDNWDLHSQSRSSSSLHIID